jgi:methylated-DNA-[protein]-cysteine S-methyltransferase
MSDPITIYTSSPIGTLIISAKPLGITALYFSDDAPPADLPADLLPVLQQCVDELRAYFAGTLRVFSVPVILEGTPFQMHVWEALFDIPYGETRTYLDIARVVGDPNAVRAVGAANGKNPVSIIAPCHRVIGSDGTLTGYGGGLWRKEWLLTHEGYPVQQRLL